MYSMNPEFYYIFVDVLEIYDIDFVKKPLVTLSS